MGLSANVEETSQVSMDQSFYVGGALSLSSARESNVDADFFSEKVGQDRLGNILLLAGYNYNQNIGIEGRFSATVSSANVAKVTTFSIFAKPQANLTNELKVYGLLGVGYVDISNNKGSNVDASKTSFQWGLGASYDINNKWGVFIDYTSLADDISGTILNSNKASLDSINIGTTFKF
jgi:opacity protein-like surface antigen